MPSNSLGILNFEDAILEMLEPLKVSSGIKTLNSYQGDLEAEDFAVILSKFPAVYLYYTGDSFQRAGGRVVATRNWSLFVCDRSFRSDKQARRGANTTVGTYAIMDAIKPLLWGKIPLAGVSAIVPVRTESVAYSQNLGVSVYEMVFSCQIPCSLRVQG